MALKRNMDFIIGYGEHAIIIETNGSVTLSMWDVLTDFGDSRWYQIQLRTPLTIDGEDITIDMFLPLLDGIGGNNDIQLDRFQVPMQTLIFMKDQLAVLKRDSEPIGLLIRNSG